MIKLFNFFSTTFLLIFTLNTIAMELELLDESVTDIQYDILGRQVEPIDAKQPEFHRWDAFLAKSNENLFNDIMKLDDHMGKQNKSKDYYTGLFRIVKKFKNLYNQLSGTAKEEIINYLLASALNSNLEGPESLKAQFADNISWKNFFREINEYISKITDDNREQKVECLAIFKYILGNNTAIDIIKNPIVKIATEEHNPAQIFGFIIDLIDNISFLNAKNIKLFEKLLSNIESDQLQELFNYTAIKLEPHGFIPFLASTLNNNIYTKILNMIYDKNSSINIDSIKGKIILDLQHIFSMPTDTHKIAGIHCWPKADSEDICQSVSTIYKNMRYNLMITAKIDPIQIVALSHKPEKYENILIKKICYSKCDPDETPQDLKDIVCSQSKASSMLPIQMMIDINMNGFFRSLKAIHDFPDYKYTTKDGSYNVIGKLTLPAPINKKIYLLLVIKNSGLIPKMCTVFPLIGFKEYPKFKLCSSEDSKDIVELISSQEDHKRCDMIKKLVISDLVSQDSDKPTKVVSNKSLISLIFDLNTTESTAIFKELESKDINKSNTVTILRSKGFADSDLLKLIEFISDSIKPHSTPLLKYYFRKKETKSDKKSELAISCPCMILTGTTMANKFPEEYNFIENIAGDSFYLHVTKHELCEAS